MSNIFERVPVGHFLQEIVHRGDVKDAVSFIKETKDAALFEGKYPSRDELKSKRLTELQYLLLIGGIKTTAAGSGSPISESNNEYAIAEIAVKASTEAKRRGVIFLEFTHGSLIPDYDQNDPKMNSIPFYSGNYEKELALVRAETLCGGSGGSMQRLRERSSSTSEATRRLLKTAGFKPTVVEIESLVGAPAFREETIAPGYVKKVPYQPITSPFSRELHHISHAKFYVKDPEKVFSQNEEVSDKEVIKKHQEMNDQVRELMNQGKLIRGNACIDRRQLVVVPDQSIINPNVQAVIKRAGESWMTLESPVFR